MQKSECPHGYTIPANYTFCPKCGRPKLLEEQELTLIRKRDSAAQMEFGDWWDQSNIAAQDRKVLLLHADRLQKSLNECRAALIGATDFVDRHSEPWYKSGQALLAKCKAALGSGSTSPKAVKP